MGNLLIALNTIKELSDQKVNEERQTTAPISCILKVMALFGKGKMTIYLSKDRFEKVVQEFNMGHLSVVN